MGPWQVGDVTEAPNHLVVQKETKFRFSGRLQRTMLLDRNGGWEEWPTTLDGGLRVLLERAFD